MSQHGLYKKSNAVDVGGIKCPCCSPQKTSKDNKSFMSRKVRRKARKDLVTQLKEDENE